MLINLFVDNLVFRLRENTSLSLIIVSPYYKNYVFPTIRIVGVLYILE